MVKHVERIFKYFLIGILSFFVGLVISIALFTPEIRNLAKAPLKPENLPKLYLVQSGSMEPAIMTGSLVVTVPSETYVQGDVISFKKDNKNVITHRIYTKLFPGGVNSEPAYKTAGDANEDFDNFEVTQKDIIGKVVVDVPYLGYVANFAQKPLGFILLVIVPATIVIYEELKSLLKEILKQLNLLFSKRFPSSLVKKRRLQNNSVTDFQGATFKGSLPRQLAGRTIKSFILSPILLPKIAVIFPVFGALLVFAGLASSLFHDTEKSSQNVLQAGIWTPPTIAPSPIPTPGPGDVVINELMWMGGFDSDDEWIELRNVSSNAINVKGWNITKWSHSASAEQILLQIPSNQDFNISPGGFFLIARRTSQAAISNLNVAPDVVDSSSAFSLNNSNLQIKLYNGDWLVATLIDTAGDKGTPLKGINGSPTDESMERNDTPGDGTLSGSWHTATSSTNFDVGDSDLGTPRDANSPP